MDWPKALSCLSRGRFHFIKWKFNRRARLDVPFLHVQGEEISVSTRRGMTSWLINMPPCSSFKLKTCPDLLEPSPLGSTDSHRFHAEAVWLSRDIAKRFQSSGPSTTQLADVQRVRATVSNTMEVLRFRSLISNPVHGAFNYSSRLAGVSWPQTCSSSLLIKVFVSERSSVNVSHHMNVCNNRRIRQHPRSFPTQNMKIHSWCTFHLLSLLSLFPLWSWLRAASRKMIMTQAGNLFHPGTHNREKCDNFWKIMSPFFKGRNQLTLFILRFLGVSDFSLNFTYNLLFPVFR